MWCHSPEWLRKDYEFWPTLNNLQIDLSKMKNEKCSSQQVLYEISEVATEVQQPKAPFKIKEKHFSTRKKLLNVTIHIKRFIENTRRKQKIHGYPTPTELEEGEMWSK